MHTRRAAVSSCPGEVIGSGTVGLGCGLELYKSLQPGDVVELEVEGIGVLRNTIGEPPESFWQPSAEAEDGVGHAAAPAAACGRTHG